MNWTEMSKSLRRKTLARFLRRLKMAKEFRKRQSRKGSIVNKLMDNLANRMTGGVVADVTPIESGKYTPLTPPKKKQLRVVIEACGLPCPRCLNRRAVIYSPQFDQDLCLECEDALVMEFAGKVLEERMPKKLSLKR